jgi:diacylglycerol kinase (ATP)
MSQDPPSPCAQQTPAAKPQGWQPGQKKLRGFKRLARATKHSIAGLAAGWHEPAFRLESVLAVPLLAAAFWIGQDWVQVSLLAGSVLAVLVVELLNTGIESVVDRIGPQWHELSKRAKDLGSAAVFLTMLGCLTVWLCALKSLLW